MVHPEADSLLVPSPAESYQRLCGPVYTGSPRHGIVEGVYTSSLHASVPVDGPGDFPSAKWLLHWPCKLGLWGSKPTWSLCALPHFQGLPLWYYVHTGAKQLKWVCSVDIAMSNDLIGSKRFSRRVRRFSLTVGTILQQQRDTIKWSYL